MLWPLVFSWSCQEIHVIEVEATVKGNTFEKPSQAFLCEVVVRDLVATVRDGFKKVFKVTARLDMVCKYGINA